MKAIIFEDKNKWSLQEVDKPVLSNPDDMLIEIEAASICGSDLHIIHGTGADAKRNTVLGHEMTGKIIEIGSSVTEFKPGDRIVLDPNIACGNCFYCRAGHPNMCENVQTLGVDIDGGFAEFCLVPEKAAVKISSELSPEQAVFAEPLTCVLSAVNKIRLLPGENVLILGAGPIGLYFELLLKANGAGNIFVSEVSEFRKEYAVENGADKVINPSKENLVKTIKNLTGGIGVDVVIDTVGVLLPDAIKCVRRAGKILLFGQNSAAQQQICQNDITRNELTIYGSYIGLHTLPATVKMLESGLIDFTNLITHKVSLDEFKTGLEAMEKGEALEVVIYP